MNSRAAFKPQGPKLIRAPLVYDHGYDYDYCYYAYLRVMFTIKTHFGGKTVGIFIKKQ